MVLIPEIFQLIEYSGTNKYIIFVKNHFSSLGVGILFPYGIWNILTKSKILLYLLCIIFFLLFEVKQYSETNNFDYIDFTFYLIGLSFFYLVYKNKF